MVAILTVDQKLGVKPKARRNIDRVHGIMMTKRRLPKPQTAGLEKIRRGSVIGLRSNNPIGNSLIFHAKLRDACDLSQNKRSNFVLN